MPPAVGMRSLIANCIFPKLGSMIQSAAARLAFLRPFIFRPSANWPGRWSSVSTLRRSPLHGLWLTRSMETTSTCARGWKHRATRMRPPHNMLYVDGQSGVANPLVNLQADSYTLDRGADLAPTMF